MFLGGNGDVHALLAIGIDHGRLGRRMCGGGFVFRGRRGLQDATWRYTLLVIACLPTVIALRPLMPKLDWQTPIAFERSATSPLPPDPSHITTSAGDSWVFADHSPSAETMPTIPTIETSNSESVDATAEPTLPTFSAVLAWHLGSVHALLAVPSFSWVVEATPVPGTFPSPHR